VENSNDAVARYDFLPAQTGPRFILSGTTLVGDLPPGQVFGPCVGSYGPVAAVCESQFIPPGYVVVVASGGPGSALNPVGVRQHTNLPYQGLKTWGKRRGAVVETVPRVRSEGGESNPL